MAKEIERKFLVTDDTYINMATKTIHIIQAYLSVNINAVVRIRIADDSAYLTIKSRTHGLTRDEWEYEIPISDAREMIRCSVSRVIDKVRYIVPYKGMIWEIDRFDGEHQGLVVAEIELSEADAQFALPPFVGEEVTGDPKYYNSALASI